MGMEGGASIMRGTTCIARCRQGRQRSKDRKHGIGQMVWLEGNRSQQVEIKLIGHQAPDNIW